MEPGTKKQETEHDEANITKINVSKDKKKNYATDSTSLEHAQNNKNIELNVKRNNTFEYRGAGGHSTPGRTVLQKQPLSSHRRPVSDHQVHPALRAKQQDSNWVPGKVGQPLAPHLKGSKHPGKVGQPHAPHLLGSKRTGKVGHPHAPQLEGSNPQGEVGHPLALHLEGSQPKGGVRQSLAHYLEGSNPTEEVGHPLTPHLQRSQPPEKAGHKLAFYLEESQTPGESSSNLDFSANDIANESHGNGAFDNEEFEQTSVVIVGLNGSWFKVICDHCWFLVISGIPLFLASFPLPGTHSPTSEWVKYSSRKRTFTLARPAGCWSVSHQFTVS